MVVALAGAGVKPPPVDPSPQVTLGHSFRLPPSAELPLPILVNDEVEEALTHLRRGGGIAEAFARGQGYMPAIREAFVQAGVPVELAYVALVESRFNPFAVSPARASGVWQFMPATATRFGLERDEWLDERRDPIKSTAAAAEYLRFLYDLFGTWDLAVAAYNAGEGRVARAIERVGSADFWELSRLEALPEETRNYVPRVYAAILMSRQPDAFGLQLDPEPLPATDVVNINEPVALAHIASCTGAGVDEIARLNPELTRAATPDRSFPLKVPEGRARRLRGCLIEIPKDERIRLHRVRRGETLARLARRYDTSAEAIAEANSLPRRARLRAGMEIVIPSG